MRPRRSPIARALALLASLAVLVAAFSACIVVEARPARSEVTTPPPAPQNEAAIACDGWCFKEGVWIQLGR
jgi:hypothetical protein